MRLVLFDIDGTLLRLWHDGRAPIVSAVEEVLGTKVDVHGVPTAGRLDPLILSDLVAANGVEFSEDHRLRLMERYPTYLAEVIRDNPERLVVMDGTHTLVAELRERTDCRIGVLTGNFGSTAKVKLRAAGFEPDWFEVEAYGDDAPDRPSLIPVALNRYQEQFDTSINASDVIIVGDTPHDIEAAKTHGCRVLAVSTGKFSRDELEPLDADLLLDSLGDLRTVLGFIFN